MVKPTVATTTPITTTPTTTTTMISVLVGSPVGLDISGNAVLFVITLVVVVRLAEVVVEGRVSERKCLRLVVWKVTIMTKICHTYCYSHGMPVQSPVEMHQITRLYCPSNIPRKISCQRNFC